MKQLRHKASQRLSEMVEYKLSKSTAKTYASFFDRFLKFCDESRPMRISVDQVYNFLFTLSSFSQKNQAINAIKFYYKYVERKPIKVKLARPKKPKRVIRDIPFDRILSGFERIENKKHRAIVVLMFGCGLRISEVINFDLEWIIKEDHLFKITGKGNKQRLVPYDSFVMNVLNEYSFMYKPVGLLFRGQNGKYSKTSIANICRKYFNCTPHQLRHSYTMKLVEKGTNLKHIQDLLGHVDIKTTLTYVRTDKSQLKKITVCT